MQELWKPIVGWEGIYEVSNHGRVKSLSRISMRGNPKVPHKLSERILKQAKNNTGRAIVYFKTEEKSTTLQVSRLVAIAFLDNPNKYTDINHIDGDCINNKIDNLEWCTRSYNIQHAWDTGLKEHYTTSLSDVDIKKIRLFHNAGCTKKFIAEIFNCSHSYVSNICSNRFRENVPNDLEYIMF
jgi:hypothetical protein